MTIKGYMQSHHTGYYLGNGMSNPPVPNITYAGTAVAPAGTVNAASQKQFNDFTIYPNPLNGTLLSIEVNVKETTDLFFTISNEKGTTAF